ncbi:MAG: tape measure protein [Candidatus Thiodiazotropha lotti]|uniref:Tape measure protein n=1 Tax=Candidatus Thiodiazotropha lotti TaxID=2792787 RepID=A0A9E4MZ87_9GAMM|nr:tape measure protein [Candidatus Thiodiazotropha lotti]MCG7937953.1 tape measure protein [Candidatus Thiodiazotropha lotti]MCW4202421.1 tape measure protein [Candidatus Thiodiazotropha lotti]MCW4222591.1 tape measure protein [Candidatus Thiodiazotropha lotti]
MATKNQISLKVKAIVEGLAEIDKLTSEIEELGGQAGDTGNEAQHLNNQFKQLEKQQQAIAQLNKLNGTISKTSADLKKARTDATALGKAMATAEKPTKALANEFERARTRVQRLKEMQAAQLTTLKAYSNRAKAAGVDTKRLTAEQVRLADATAKIKSKITGVSAELTKTRNSYRAAAKEAKSYGAAVNTAGKFSGMLGRLLPVAALAGVVKWFKDAATGADSLKKGFEVVSGSAESAGKEMDYLRKTASRLGLPLREAGKAYLSLTAAAKGTRLEGQASRKIFEAVSLAMGKLGRSSAETEGALLAIQQMISKGKVSAEELRGQLGERLPGAFQAAARAMGVTTAELDKMLKSGEVIAEDLLPKLAQELNDLYDDGSRIDTFGASWNRLKNSISGAFSAINESSGAMNVLGGALEGLGSAVTLVSVGFVTLTEKIKGASTMARAFWDAATSKDVTLNDALKRTKAAWEDTEKAIRKAADTAFNADSNLSKLGKTTQETGIKVVQLGNAASKTAGDVKELDDNQKDATQSTIENKEASQDLTVQMYDLAASYRKGKITSQDFYRSMQKLSAAAAAQRAAAAQVAAGNREIASSANQAASAVVQGEQRAAAARSQGMQSFQNFWQQVKATYHSISASIGAQYDEMIERLGRTTQSYQTSLRLLSMWLKKLDRQAKDYVLSAQGYGESLSHVISQAAKAVANMKVLDGQKLSQLRAQIGAARAALRALNDDARATLSSIRQELAELQGDTLGAERFRYQQRREALEAQLENAIRQGATQGAADLRAALAALQRVHNLRMQQIRAQQEESGQVQSGSSAQPLPPVRSGSGTGLTNNLVEVRFSTGAGLGTSTGYFTDDGLGAFLQQLEDAGATTE